ncbi:Protein of unknown function [Alkalibacterium subtropicum]|uniref:DUF1510 domain-containing protein n=1 Tax=Alkalibacterium subtropicum TaxID=753702 RepID=A0A1I1K2D1_9LACT|nr:DUF1510 family protein [Alkalibacterium subtropicum]SFC52133.1 Protein of unknown function [Alkalibacterium subtropicum]
MKKTRANKNNPNTPKNNSKIEKIYYVVIGLLLVILGGLVIFIFANQDDVVTDEEPNGDPESGMVSETDEDNTDEDTATEEGTDEEPAEEDTEEAADEETADQDVDTEAEEATEEAEDEPEENVEDETDEAAEEETEEPAETDEPEEEAADEPSDADINADAPLNDSYNINFSDGSSDRNAIAQNASAVSGISQGDMITWWVGNDGPGRAFTVVSDSGRNTVYRVYLQYGEGEWHITAAEELDSVPSEYR